MQTDTPNPAAGIQASIQEIGDQLKRAGLMFAIVAGVAIALLWAAESSGGRRRR